MKKALYTLLPVLLFFSTTLIGQNIVPVAFDLASPIDVNLDAEGNAWVTQSGSGANDGLVQRIASDGSKETIIEGLPSHFNVMLNELEGALSTQVMADGRIFVCQGGGPDSLSASILEFHWDDYVAKGAPLTTDDRRAAVMVGQWALANGFAESNPYSFLINAEGDYLISDAAANAVFKYAVDTEEFSVLTAFPPFMNPTPIGPPFVDIVPTKILAHPEGGYLVSSLTGFPFLDGASNVYHVLDDGTSSFYAAGLTLVTDMDFDPNDGQLVTLQFAAFGPVDSTFGFIFNSAQLVKVDGSGGLDTVAAGFGPSPGLAFAADGSAYMTHLFLGQLLKSDPLSSGIFDFPETVAKPIRVFPNPNDGRFAVEVVLENGGELHYQLTDQLGRVTANGTTTYLPKGENLVNLDFMDERLVHGLYQLNLWTEKEKFVGKVVIQ